MASDILSYNVVQDHEGISIYQGISRSQTASQGTSSTHLKRKRTKRKRNRHSHQQPPRNHRKESSSSISRGFLIPKHPPDRHQIASNQAREGLRAAARGPLQPWAHNYFSGIGKLDGCIAE